MTAQRDTYQKDVDATLAAAALRTAERYAGRYYSRYIYRTESGQHAAASDNLRHALHAVGLLFHIREALGIGDE